MAAAAGKAELPGGDGSMMTVPAVEIRVEDNGAGVSSENRERIFEPFFQVDSSSTRLHGGSGLGLSIALQVVKEHNGRIYVRNRPQGGTIFRLSFPVPEETEGAES